MPPIDRSLLPTIGSFRRQGMLGLLATCTNVHCRHTATLTFDALGMDDSTVFIEIPLSPRFRCTKCQGRKIEVFPDWSAVRASGAGAPRA